MKSRIDLPKTHMAGDKPVSLSGVLRYWSMARWKWSVFSVPSVPVLSINKTFNSLNCNLGPAVAVRECD